jgi:hypothetical protein
MKTLEDVFCTENTSTPAQFRRAFLWKTVPLHGIPVTLLMGGFSSRYFAADRKLLDAASAAEDMNDIRAAINDYLGDAAERSWLRTLLGLEISPWRLKYFARCYLPGISAAAVSNDPFQVFQKIGQ